jgi:hypothetical protein
MTPLSVRPTSPSCAASNQVLTPVTEKERLKDNHKSSYLCEFTYCCEHVGVRIADSEQRQLSAERWLLAHAHDQQRGQLFVCNRLHTRFTPIAANELSPYSDTTNTTHDFFSISSSSIGNAAMPMEIFLSSVVNP